MLLFLFALSMAGPLAAPAHAQEVVELNRDWALKPSGVSAGEKFRLFFVTSTTRNAASSNIADYNSFVQSRAAAGHSAIQSFSSKFKVMASTESVNARNNTASTYTSSNKGVPIWWVNGAKVADHYQDFYDGTWDNKNGHGKNELGNGVGNSERIWTGSSNNGTKSSRPLGNDLVTIIRLQSDGTLTLRGNTSLSTQRANHGRLFALSPVLRVADGVKAFGVSITSTPADTAAGYAAGEKIQVRVDFGENMSVTELPYLALDIAGVPRRAVYESGSGTRYLVFAYTVVAADFDSNGVSLCSSRALDAGCGRIALAGGTIQAVSDNAVPELDLPELGNQSGHKVDGNPDFMAEPVTAPMPNPGTGSVPRDWALIPSGFEPGDRFRLLFVSSTTRNGSSLDINVYNNHVIAAAGSGDTAIRALRGGFRALGSTGTVDARDNTATTYTSSNKGVPIYWLNGDKVADDYEDFYDNSWDNKNGKGKNELGGSFSNSSHIWTGSNNDGTKDSDYHFGSGGSVRVVRLEESATLSGENVAQTQNSYSLLALSQVLQVRSSPVPVPAMGGFVSEARSGGIFRRGETIAFELPFSEPVVVRGVPTVALDLESGTVAMRYVSGSGTERLRFEHTVQAGDYDTDGVLIRVAQGEDYVQLDGATIRAVADNTVVLLALGDTREFTPSLHNVEGRSASVTDASIVSTPQTGDTYGSGETIRIRLAMREAVQVTGQPYVLLDIGGTPRQAGYYGRFGRSTNALEFRYTVQAGDTDTDGVALCASGAGCGSIQLNGGSILGVADGGIDAALDLPALGAQSGHKVDAMQSPPGIAPPSIGADPVERAVASAWALKPTGVSVGDKFRLLFVTSTTRDAESSNIADYNRFVQGRAAAGHAEIRTSSIASQFRVVGSTASVDARDNTATTYTASNTGVPIYWLNGAKAADNYQDFYDGSWDSERGRNEAGRSQGTNCRFIIGGDGTGVWTGSRNNGTKHQFSGGGPLGDRFVAVGGLSCNDLDPLSASNPRVTDNYSSKQFYALSQVFRVSDLVRGFSVSISSTPADRARGYNAGETIRIRVDFGEPVTVRGLPYLLLDVGGGPRPAIYASGSGTRYLVFSYRVVRADVDDDGVSLCSSRLVDPGCGRITLNSGSIQAADTFAAELDLPELGNQTDHKINGEPDFTSEPVTPPMGTPSGMRVPANWSLTPRNLGKGHSFRLLFVSSAPRDATASDINAYNNHVIALAGTGHTSIREFKDGFRAIASTTAVEARDNAALSGTGVPIHWMNGVKVADNYGDFLDGTWDSEAFTPESGGSGSTNAELVWTGSTDRALGSGRNRLGTDALTLAALGALNDAGNPLAAGRFAARTESHALYALSQEFTTPPRIVRSAFESTPIGGDTYRIGETIAVEVTFSEPINVSGEPQITFQMNGTGETPGSGLRAMRYAAGSGTTILRFEYVVQRGDFAGGMTPLSAPHFPGVNLITLEGGSIQAVLDNVDAHMTSRETSSASSVDARPPVLTGASVTSAPASDGGYRAGETFTVRFTVREPVRVTGEPYVVLSVGGALRQAVYSGPVGTATGTLDFSYVVQMGDYDADGPRLCASGPECGSVVLNGGSIQAASDGLAAVLQLPPFRTGHRVDTTDQIPTTTPGTACTDVIEVPGDWALRPSGVADKRSFRLVFLTTTTRDARALGISAYNTVVVDDAEVGHPAIQPYKDGFKVLGSTRTTNVRNNSCTTGTGRDANNKDIAIYWVDGAKVANNYSDLYDGSWTNLAAGKNSYGRDRPSVIVWTGTNDNGTTGEYLGRQFPNFAQPFTESNPFDAGAGGFGNSSTNARAFYGLSQVFRVRDVGSRSVAIISSPASGNTYRRGEVIEFEVTFSEAVNIRGTPNLALEMRDGSNNAISTFIARYSHNSGTAKPVFTYTVESDDRAPGGIATQENPLKLNGALITATADNFRARTVLAGPSYIQGSGSRSMIDGSLEPATGGVCPRTPRVRDKLVELVRAAQSNTSLNCEDVTDEHLGALTDHFEIRSRTSLPGITALKTGDFAGLSGIERMTLVGQQLVHLPEGVFDGLGPALTLLILSDNNLQSIAPGVFDLLTGLEGLVLTHNDLESLPPGLFEKLTQVAEVHLLNNPGTGSFKLSSDAGPGATLSASETVTLGGPGNDTGAWGSNVTYTWVQIDADGAPVSTVTLSEPATAQPTFVAPTLATETVVRLGLTIAGMGSLPQLYSDRSFAQFTIRGLAPTLIAPASEPISGDSYGEGETIEVIVTFGDRVLVDTSLGTPQLTLTVGTETHQASYVRGTGSNQLVFAYGPVASTDEDTDGIHIAANSLTLNGAVITNLYGTPAILTHAALVTQPEHKVDGSTTALTGGICDRTPKVRDVLLERVRTAQSDTSLSCADVTNSHLGALSGPLWLNGGPLGVYDGDFLTELKDNDFDGLTGIERISLTSNRLRSIPSGIFDPMTSVTRIGIRFNGARHVGSEYGLADLPAGLFDRVTGLTTLELDNNDFTTLPVRIFEPLTNLRSVDLSDNPWVEGFLPIAKAGPEDGIDTVSGGTATLGVEGAADGFDDPWGSNVGWVWKQLGGPDALLSEGATPQASVTAPATSEDTELVFRLLVIGKGNVSGFDVITVRVAAGPAVTGVAFASTPEATQGYDASEHVDVTLRFNRPVNVDTTSGTPSVELMVGTTAQAAQYVSGSGSSALVFRYAVQDGETDTDGVDLIADSLVTNSATITGVSDGGKAPLGHAALAGGTGQLVRGDTAPVMTGVCPRSPAVAAAIVAKLGESDRTITTCSQVTEAHLQGITGTLDVSAQALAHGRMTALKAGDFAGLAGLTGLDLDNHAIRVFPAGIFDPLIVLTELSIAYNQTQAADSLMTLPAGLFDRLTGLTELRLEHNDISTLPANIFEKLTALDTLTLDANPGSAQLIPEATAGPAGGLDATSGEIVTLGGDRSDPWGSNVEHAWRQSAGLEVSLSATNVAAPTFSAPGLAQPQTLVFEVAVTGAGAVPGTPNTHRTVATVSVRVAATAVPRTVSLLSEPFSGNTYKRDETIEIAVTFSQAVTVVPTPQLALTIGTDTRQAQYARGSGTNQLVFEYMVAADDTDTVDGISVPANSLALGAGAITTVDGTPAILDHTALAPQSAHKVDGSTTGLTGGICARTAQVRGVLLERVRTAQSDATLSCADVTNAHLTALSGTLNLIGGPFGNLGGGTINGLRAGDFRGLSAITALSLTGNTLRSIPAGVFDEMTALTELILNSNGTPGGNGLSTLPAGLFDRLTGLTVLRLDANDIASLPPRIFEALEALTELQLQDNPGSAQFVPSAMAGDDIEVAQRDTVILGVAGAEDGFDDPWGSNVTSSWTQTSGTPVLYAAGKGADTLRPEFRAPALDETLTFSLTVQGTGGTFTGTDTVDVRISSPVIEPPIPQSAVVNGASLTLTYADDLQDTNPASEAGSGPVYLAVLTSSGSRRSIQTAPGTGAQASGRAVTMTLAPPAAYGDTVTLSYFPDNAVAASRVRDVRGTLANDFSGLEVRNDTPESPHVDDLEFTGATQTYALDETIALELTFSEAVQITLTPTVDLVIGSPAPLGTTPPQALYVSGTGTDTLRFEYTVAEGDRDTNGIAVAVNGLKTGSGSSIVTVAQSAAVTLSHRSEHDAGYRVDGVRPTISSAVVAGPELTITWSEDLDPMSGPPTAGQFTVKVDGVAGPAVRAVAFDDTNDRLLRLTLALGIRSDATGVTLVYVPGTRSVTDVVGNAAEAFDAQEVTPATADNNPATGRVTVTGTATVGQVLTAQVSDIADRDGPPSTRFTFTWVRIEAGEESVASTRTALGTQSIYALTAADTGKRVRATVEFEDHIGNSEELESDPYPGFGRVMWGADAACAMPDLASRELVWTGLMGVALSETMVAGITTSAYGYSPTLTGSTLSDTTFSLGGTGYTIDSISVGQSGALTFSVNADLPTSATGGLALHVCDDDFHFGDGPDAGTARDSAYDSTDFSYSWTSSGLDWSGHATRRLYLSQADTTAPALERITADGATLTMIYDEALKATQPAASDGDQVFAASTVGVGSFLFTPSNARAGVGPNRNQVTMTLDPPAEAGRTIALKYSGGSATAASKVQDLAGNAAAAFRLSTDLMPPVPVDNVTPEGPHVDAVAFAGEAKTYAIADVIGVDVTFSESVRVTATPTARPTIGLEIGTATRKAVWKTGQSAGATHRFEYTVAEGDLDMDGIAIRANTLETPAGSAIATSDDSEAVQPSHGSRQDPAHPVDGVRPTASEAAAAGPTVTVTWSEALDEASVPSGAGGFRVRIGNANGPAVISVGISGMSATLSLASAIADGTQDVTLEYTPPSGAKVRDAAGNDARAIPRTDALDVNVIPDTRAPEVSSATVDGTALKVTFDEALDATSIPTSSSAFTVTVSRDGSPVSGVTVSTLSLSPSGTVLTVTLSQAVRGGDTVTLAYRPPAQSPLRDRATTPNQVAAFSGRAVDNQTPSVTGVAFAGSAGALAIGGTVAVEATFTQAVRVTTSASARPQIGVSIGANTRQARYVSGAGTATLRFEYTVVQGDEDRDGIAIAEDALTTPSGSAIRTQAGNRAVQLGHDEVATDPARTVDGLRPTASEAAAAGPTVTVTWSEALDEASVPSGAGGFRVRIGNANGPEVTSVGISEMTTTLSLASAIADGTTNVTLEYTPASGAKVRDAAGNDAAAIPRANALDVDVTPDTRAPEVSGATIDGTALKVTFDEALDASSIPAAPGGFTVSVSRDGSPVSGVTVSTLSLSPSGTVLTLTLSQAVRGGDVVTLAYAAPSQTPLQDRAVVPNQVATFSARTVDNSTPSVTGVAFADAASLLAIGDKIGVEVTFTEAVRVTTSGSARPQIGIGVGTDTQQAVYVSGSGTTTLRFEYTVVERDEDNDGVAIAANALETPSGSAIVTQAGNRSVQLGHDEVATDPARKVDGVRPTASEAAAAGPTITITWSEALDEGSASADTGGFLVRIGSSNGPAVNAVAISGMTTTLNLASAIAHGTANVTLEYTPPSGSKIRDLAGNDAAAIARTNALDATVTPDTRAPEVSQATVDGTALEVTFDETLDAASIPADAGGFTVIVTRAGAALPGYTVSGLSLDGAGTVLTLTLSQAVRSADVVTLAYSVPSQMPLQDRAMTPNQVAAFTARAVDNHTPSVTDVAFAGAASRLAIGDVVAVEVTFTEAVRVATSSAAEPLIAIGIGTNTREAGYLSGSGSPTIRFEYTIVEGDEDEDGIAIAANALETPSGSSIVTQAGNRTVQLDHDEIETDPARTVDGVRPTASEAAASGPTVTVTWSEALDETSVPSHAGGFQVRIGSSNGPDITAVNVSGMTTTLSLASEIADGTADVTLEYTPPSGATIRDAAGNDAAAIARADALSVMVTPDTRAPEVSSATVDGTALKVTFDEALDTTSIPAAAGGFTVTVTRGDNALSGYTVTGLSLNTAGTGLTLTLSQGVRGGDVVTLAYTVPSQMPLQDRAMVPNQVATFAARTVDNSTPSVTGLAFADAPALLAIDDKVAVEATFTEAVRVATSGSARPQIALDIGANTRQARYVSGSGTTTLRFEYTVVNGDEDNNGIGIAENVLQTPSGSSIVTQAGSRAVQLGHDEVEADPGRTVDGSRPTVSSAAADGLTVTVTWSEAIDPTSSRSDAGGFTLRYGGSARPEVTEVTVDGTDGTKVLLTVDAQIPDGIQDATLAWNPPGSGTRIRDLAGNEPEPFTDSGDRIDVDVTPDTTKPEVAGATINGAVLTVSFNERLNESSAPTAPGGFTVGVLRDGSAISGHTVNEIRVSNKTVTLRLAQGVVPGDTVTLAYAKPTQNPLQDRAVNPNEVDAFTTGSGAVPGVVNRTGALEITLSKTQVTEGEDSTVTLTVKLPDGATAGADRQIAIAAASAPTAQETQDWTLETTSETLAIGEQSVAFAITVIDDANLEGEESVIFEITADGAPSGNITLNIADDDRAVLTVTGPEGPVAEGGTSFTLKLRLEPGPENGPPITDDACFLDFAVAATLSATGNEAELSATPARPVDVSFPATSLTDCTREVELELTTRASDGDWSADRTVSFSLERTTGEDERVNPGVGTVTVRDDSPVPGPLITDIAVSPMPPEASEDYKRTRNKAEFEAVPDDAVHGPGAVLTFALTFDHPVTVERTVDNGAWPQLVLDVFGRTRRATLTGDWTDTRTLTFRWTVEQGDYDPNGIAIRTIDTGDSKIKFAAGCQVVDGAELPCTLDVGTFVRANAETYPAHRVRGGFFEMQLVMVENQAREGEPFVIRVDRDGGSDEHAAAFVRATDSAVIDPNTGQPKPVQFAVELHADDSQGDVDGKWNTGSYALPVPGDGTQDAQRVLTFQLTGSGGTQTTAWYDLKDTGEVTVPVTDAEIVSDGPGFSVGPADVHEPETGTVPLIFRVCLWSRADDGPSNWCPSEGQPIYIDVDGDPETPGIPMAFEEVARNDLTHEVRVDYATEDGTATAQEKDYIATSGTLVFAPGEIVKTVTVEVLADAHDEGLETLWLELSNPVGAVIERHRNFGQIHNNGPIPKAWITRFGRTVGTQVVDALTQRFEAGDNTHVTLGGISLIGAETPEERDTLERTLTLPEWDDPTSLDETPESMTWQELVAGSSFHLSTGAHEGGTSLTAWGTISTGSFDATEDQLTLDGEVKTGLFGADAQWDRFLAGVMVSQSAGNGAYRLGQEGDDNGDEGTIEATLTGIYPYLKATLNERVSAWGLAGFGSGNLTVKRRNETFETDLGMRMGALGMEGRVLDGSGPTGIGLSLKTDAMWVETKSERTEGMMAAEGDVTRLRLIVQGDRAFATEGGGFVPSAEIGLRVDGGDAETGAGVELGAGLRYARGRLSIEGQLRGLVAHEDSGYKEWGMSGAVRVVPSASGKGLTLSVVPVWGSAGSQAEQLWGAQDARQLDPGAEFEARAGLNSELGYGIGVPHTLGVITPYTALSLVEDEARTVRAGVRWSLSPGAVFGLESTWQDGTHGESGTNAVEFRAELRW